MVPRLTRAAVAARTRTTRSKVAPSQSENSGAGKSEPTSSKDTGAKRKREDEVSDSSKRRRRDDSDRDFAVVLPRYIPIVDSDDDDSDDEDSEKEESEKEEFETEGSDKESVGNEPEKATEKDFSDDDSEGSTEDGFEEEDSGNEDGQKKKRLVNEVSKPGESTSRNKVANANDIGDNQDVSVSTLVFIKSSYLVLP